MTTAVPVLKPFRRIAELLTEIPCRSLTVPLPPDLECASIQYDSRKVVPGALFFAVVGVAQDGRQYIDKAIAQGAVAVVTEAAAGECFEQVAGLFTDRSVPVILVEDCRVAVAQAAKRFFGSAADTMTHIGVTGTNGKTSTTWILAEALSRLEGTASHIGTLGMRVVRSGNTKWHTEDSLTSPDHATLHQFFADVATAGSQHQVMEASSHALDQRRLWGIPWKVAVFTNLTRDHLDYHGTMEDYERAKRELFFRDLAQSPVEGRVAVVNIDDPAGKRLAGDLGSLEGVRVLAFSSSGAKADVRLVSADLRITGSILELEISGAIARFKVDLLGAYNAENCLAAITVLVGLGYRLEQIAEVIAQVPRVPGRMELAAPADVAVVVDYAHTPDALRSVQRSLRELIPGRLITVFGCGGNRDRGKRRLMGEAVREFADLIVVTSDNPRFEEPQAIIDDVLPSLQGDGVLQSGDEAAMVPFEAYVDREQAIVRAISLSQPGDTILIAGKGHEPYQEIKGVKYPFSDTEVSRRALQLAGRLRIENT